MNLIELEKVLKKSWSKETSYCPDEWSESNSSLGQCAITALVVNDYFGGEIVWADALLPNGQKISHYFNLIDGKVVDLTRSQFPEGTIIPDGVEKKKDFVSTREFMLSSDNTKIRYESLKEVVINLTD
ncbi:MAG: hypothetical protein COY69_01465 [Candidatus Magasanikbacteria bacterium CG_4_10_14_0_8_um_filter_32_14]|uniref:Uncharacterized protein n=2 Tax=Candidatus Magasanikiibacteriota TaxID=1752731 RepID=A0A2M7R9P6_9BACT|nr:MAG: hypothetical protein AUJ23_02320 [Candidatus Magasanikbacteria bacterium CG1_02_32_51]PIY93473.1 MAG: hypothetical protein COY69_01465 [Candidatus Magasanikbacteria bacterium CG_4_10_14_0_8_um_filter_32_14]